MAAKGDEALLGHVKILKPDRRDEANISSSTSGAKFSLKLFIATDLQTKPRTTNRYWKADADTVSGKNAEAERRFRYYAARASMRILKLESRCAVIRTVVRIYPLRQIMAEISRFIRVSATPSTIS